MKVLCSFPGKFGDLIWALPTIRALSRRVGEPIDLMLASELVSIIPLLRAQPYLGAVWCNGTWITENTAPISPRMPPDTAPDSAYSDTDIYDRIFHLGYRGWPARPLPFEILNVLHAEGVLWGAVSGAILEEELHLEEPWIIIPQEHKPAGTAIGFTDEYFELKYGITVLLQRSGIGGSLLVGSNPRWQEEAGAFPMDWVMAAGQIKHCKAFLGCCSALHVLAVAVGTPAVVMEPSPARHNSIFWPLGTDGPQVYAVRGGDGQQTFDARATRALLQRVLEGRP